MPPRLAHFPASQVRTRPAPGEPNAGCDTATTPILHEGHPEQWRPPLPAERLKSILDIHPIRELDRFLEAMARNKAGSVPRALPPRARPAIAQTGKKGGGRVQKEQVLLPEPSQPVKEARNGTKKKRTAGNPDSPLLT